MTAAPTLYIGYIGATGKWCYAGQVYETLDLAEAAKQEAVEEWQKKTGKT
jgi:hypothetical protein